MRQFPRYLGNIAQWAVDVVKAQDDNAADSKQSPWRYQFLGAESLTWAASIALDTKANPRNCYRGTATSNATFTASNVGNSGRLISFVITNDASSNRTLTFSTGFKPTATLVGTTSKTATLLFVEAGGYLWEIARTTGIT